MTILLVLKREAYIPFPVYRQMRIWDVFHICGTTGWVVKKSKGESYIFIVTTKQNHIL